MENLKKKELESENTVNVGSWGFIRESRVLKPLLHSNKLFLKMSKETWRWSFFHFLSVWLQAHLTAWVVVFSQGTVTFFLKDTPIFHRHPFSDKIRMTSISNNLFFLFLLWFYVLLHSLLCTVCRSTWRWSRSQTLSTTETSWGWKLKRRAIMISHLPMAAAVEVEPYRRDSDVDMRRKPVSMADLWSPMTSEAPLMSSHTRGEGSLGKQKEI